MAATVTSKGQVTIPKRIREQLGLKAGSQVEFVVVQGNVVLERVGVRDADALAGCLKAYAKNLSGKSHREIRDEVLKEVAHEAVREGLPARRQRRS